MARARNLKPGFFKNEDLAECSAFARLCFAGLWTLADREGRLEDRPKRIKGELFAFDSIEVEPLLGELERHGFIYRYSTQEGVNLIQIVEFAKHQNPHHREPDSEFPSPESLGLDRYGNFRKPRALPASHAPPARGQPRAFQASQQHQAPDEPQASLGLDPPRVDLARGSSRAESPFSDSPFRNTDSGTLIPERASLRSAPSQGVADATASARDESLANEAPAGATRRGKKAKSPGRTTATWEAYAAAYRQRYDIEPVRNATVNGQLSLFVAKLGAEEAPAVAAFYLQHQRTDYVRSLHDTSLLVRDAAALRTQWATRQQVTHTQAAQADRTQTNANAFAPLIAEASGRNHR